MAANYYHSLDGNNTSWRMRRIGSCISASEFYWIAWDIDNF